MKDEIKEILDGLEKISTPTGISYSGDVTINNDDVKILKDYITNLQEKSNNQTEEINRLYKQREKFMKKYDYLKEENKSLKELNVCVGCNNNPDYKSRNEKTIELLNRHDIDTGDIYYKYNGRFVKSELKERIREILGGDEE